MGGNLAKAPLIGVCYGALMWFVVALLPRSQAYSEAAAAFQMPVLGLVMLVIFGLLAVIAWAVAYGGAKSGGIPQLAMVALTTLGLQWVAPMLRQLVLGATGGVMTKGDTLFQVLGGCAATLPALVLAMLLFKTEGGGDPKKEARHPAEAKYKLHPLGLVIRLLVLPLIYFLLYYLSWYFLFWRVDAAREFHGAAEKLNFMGELINILINHGSQAAVTLLVGLAYALFCLPLLFRMQGKRVLYIAAVTVLYLTGAVFYLIPSPVMPDPVRMAHLPETGLVMLAYGVLSGLLLHTSFKKQVAPVAAEGKLSGDKPEGKPAAKGAKKPQRKAAPAK